jgi:uncharacterized protein YbaR (Trm112 family)
MPDTATATLHPHHDVIFFELVPEYCGGETLPACPDGSGDLWWDDASYIRYQAWDGPTCNPQYLVREVTTLDYCDGVARAMEIGAVLCESCRAAYDAAASWADCPF